MMMMTITADDDDLFSENSFQRVVFTFMRKRNNTVDAKADGTCLKLCREREAAVMSCYV